MATRRDFLKRSALAGAAAAFPARSYARILGANETVRVGVVGVGQMARRHLNHLLGFEDAAVVALSDVYRPNLDWASARAPEAEAVGDYRRILDRADVDAVVVATPDHWHALPTVEACAAGKDVYVEKPTSVQIEEGRKMVAAARQHDRIVQVGTQQRSGPGFQAAADLVRSGRLGPISMVRCWNYSHEFPDGIGAPPDSAAPPDLDWDLWLGPAPEVPYNVNRFGVVLNEEGNYTRWASFRWFWDYAGGMMTDWGVHLIDIVQWAMDVEAPEAVNAVGGKFYIQDNRETPDTIMATYQYPGFVLAYENRLLNNHPTDGRPYGILFYGTEGTLFVDRGGYALTPQPGSSLEPLTGENAGNNHAAHMRNFLDCVKSREQPICDIEVGHRSTSAAILGNLAYRTGTRIAWDAQAESARDNPAVNALVRAQYRDPWTL